MVQIKGKVKPIGPASFHILIPKALIDCGVLDKGKEYIFKVEEVPQEEQATSPLRKGPIPYWKHFKPTKQQLLALKRFRENNRILEL